MFFFSLVEVVSMLKLVKTYCYHKDVIVSVPVENLLETMILSTMSTQPEDSQMLFPLLSLLFLIKCTDHLLSISDVIHRN